VDVNSPMKRLARVLTAVEIGVAALSVVTIFVLVLYLAAQRHLPVPNVVWAGELSEFALIWLTFGAAGVLVTQDGHIALKLVDTLRSPRLVRAVHVLAMVLVATIAAAFAWACWQLVSAAGYLTSPALGLPMSWVYAITLVGLVSTTVRALVRAVGIARGGPLTPDEDLLPPTSAPSPSTGEATS
jgi:TRAP-type C4-dicarboxylate transport system permease small subunit